jgi:hypothetical protein
MGHVQGAVQAEGSVGVGKQQHTGMPQLLLAW